MLSPGEVIDGRFRVVRWIGEGSMASVWAAINESIGREVAIKVMHPELAAMDRTAIERFSNEARTCGQLKHPGVVDVHDVGRLSDGAPFMVMELLDGVSLDRLFVRSGPMQPRDALPIVRDAARTLAYAHRKGILHRDIKPGNLFLHRDASGRVEVKVLDFGVAKATKTGKDTKLTAAGTILGTPGYLSPEQALGKLDLDGRSDVYALGVVLFEALTGRLPFVETTHNALLMAAALKDAPKLLSVAPAIPSVVADLVDAALVHDRDARLPSADALADRIESALVALGASATRPIPDLRMFDAGGASGAATAITLPERLGGASRMKRLMAAGAALVGLAGLVGGAAAVLRQPPIRAAAIATATTAPADRSATFALPEPPAVVPAPTLTAQVFVTPAEAASSSTSPPPPPRIPPAKRPASTKRPSVWGYD